jgi:hypothetical protein
MKSKEPIKNPNPPEEYARGRLAESPLAKLKNKEK